MFKPHYGKCIECARNQLIVVKKGYCKRCNEQKKRNKSAPFLVGENACKMIERSLKQKRREPTGELELFKEIWNERPHICEVSGVLIRRFDVRCFSHILPKGAYPKARLWKENIKLVTPEIHHEWDFGSRNQKKFDWVREKAEKLKQQHNAI